MTGTLLMFQGYRRSFPIPAFKDYQGWHDAQT
jgi:hypothetical protein